MLSGSEEPVIYVVNSVVRTNYEGRFGRECAEVNRHLETLGYLSVGIR